MDKKLQRVFAMPLAEIHPHYVTKAEKKGHTREEVDLVIRRLTGYDQAGLEQALEERRTLADFFEQAPAMTPKQDLITGSICGYKVQEIEDPLMRKIRALDKLVDELARGKKLTSILRGDEPESVG